LIVVETPTLFAMQMQSIILIASLSMTILPRVVPVVAAMPTTANSEAQEVSSIVISAVGLSRFGGHQAAPHAGPTPLFSASNAVAQFPPQGAALEIPFWVQLLTASALLGIFAAATSDDEDKAEDDEKKTVELVRAPVIAARLAGASGLFGVHGGLRAASVYLQNVGLQTSQMFPPLEANMDVPTWAQLLMASMLLGIFAAAISDDDSEKDTEAKKTVDLVSVPAIAIRFAVAAALFAAPGAVKALATAFGPSANFATMAVTTEVPACAQFAVASLLLGVFALAVAEDAEDEKDSKTVNLIRVHVIAARLSVAAGCVAAHSLLRDVNISSLSLPSSMLTSSPSFATSELATDTPQWVQLMIASVLLAVFAALASDDDTEDSESQKTVQLIRVPAIAARFAVASALFAAPGALRAASATFGPSANFATSQLTLDTPVYAQLAVVSMLLGVFAVATSEEEDKESSKQVKLVRVPAIAGRLAIATGCFAVHAAMAPSLPAVSFSGLQQLHTFGKSLSSPAIFPASEAGMDIPIWAQLLVASGLVGIFAAATSEDEEPNRQEKTVELVRVPAIAARLAAALAMFGAPGALRAASAMLGSQNLPLSELDSEVPVWAQLAVVSLLLSVFAAAVSEDDAKDEQDIEAGVKLVQVPSIAGRLAVATACFAVHAAFAPSVPALSFGGVKNVFTAAKAAYAQIPMKSSPAFASAEIAVETPVWTQLLVVSGLLFVFAYLLWTESSQNKEEEKDSKKVSPKQVQLVRPDAIAARLGVAAALFAIREVMPPLDTTALPGDMLAKGGLLVAGTAFALSGEIQKSMCAKKVV
jgi:hypothetical protein